MTLRKKRILLIGLGIAALLLTMWCELFVQRKQHLIGGGISRAFLFLLINAHIVVIVFLLYAIVRHSIKLFIERRKGISGSAFKTNLLFAFMLFSVIPSFFVFFAAGKFITKSIDRWFQARLETGFGGALALHEAHMQPIHDEIAKIGKLFVHVVARHKASQIKDWQSCVLHDVANASGYTFYVWQPGGGQVMGRLHDEVKVWRTFRAINDRTTQSLRQSFLQQLHEVVLHGGGHFDFYGSLYWAATVDNMMCVVAYRYPETIRKPLIVLQNAYDDYYHLYALRPSIYLNYFFTFFLITILIFFLSLWCAFYLARGLSKPIQELLTAVEKFRQGNWDVQVPIDETSDLQNLASGFNEMVHAVRQAHVRLESNNKEMLAILEGMLASVFLVNKTGRIVFCNAAAHKLVRESLNVEQLQGKRVWAAGHAITQQLLEFARMVRDSSKDFASKEVSFTIHNRVRIFSVYGRFIELSTMAQPEQKLLLVVLDDLTDVVKVNTMKTWQEAAKQMAHEIKNPLTPIQLATQRLQRRFKDVLHNNQIFVDCTNTILNHVTIIKDLVSHFSCFACMPSPHIECIDIAALIRDVFCLYHMSYPDITFTVSMDEEMLLLKTDKEKLRLVLINLLDNSVRVLLQTMQPVREVILDVRRDATKPRLHLRFSDNGPGIAQTVQKTLFLPYVSTEKKNMGLGLAIVHDTIVQLGGSISLESIERGAAFHIVLPL